MFFQREWDIIKLKKRARRELPDGDYDTLAGMIMAKLGYIPKEGEHPTVEAAYTLFTVEEVDERRIEKVRVEKLPIPKDETDEKSDKKDKSDREEKREKEDKKSSREE